MIKIYTDGSSLGNPGPGGLGVILVSGPHQKEIAEGYRYTTNNRMELMAVIRGIEALKNDNQNVEIISDSKYVVEAVEKKWVFGWEKKKFKDKKNPDLWIRFLEVYPKHHIKFKWIKGHNAHFENERCDELARGAATGSHLLIDAGYEAESGRKRY
jgi:ribonuclease HI